MEKKRKKKIPNIKTKQVGYETVFGLRGFRGPDGVWRPVAEGNSVETILGIEGHRDSDGMWCPDELF